jgi:hypothetical protein
MPVPNPPSVFIGKDEALVGVPQWSKFGGRGVEFGESWECDIAKSGPSLTNKLIF